MKPKTILTTAAVLILLFGIAHTLGYPWMGPVSQAQRALLIDAFSSTATVMQGFTRTYSDTHVGFGLFISVFFFTQAFLTWRLSRLVEINPGFAKLCSVLFAAQYVVTIVLETQYLFWGPIVFSSLIATAFLMVTFQLRTVKNT